MPDDLPEMLQELIEMLEDGEIEDCWHPEPALNEEWCDPCFIKNHTHVSEEDPAFTEETTEKQRDTIQRLWNRHCDGADWDDED